jgi:hypothetical protein
MPLASAVTTLTNELAALYDFVANADPAPTADELAQKWTDAFANFLVQATNPVFNPAAIEAGKAVMQPLLAATIMSPPPAGLIALTAGLTAFCAATTPLVVPFVSVPPPAPLPPPPPAPAPSPVAAAAMAATILAWAITGTASVPPAPPVPWA